MDVTTFNKKNKIHKLLNRPSIVVIYTEIDVNIVPCFEIDPNRQSVIIIMRADDDIQTVRLINDKLTPKQKGKKRRYN